MLLCAKASNLGQKLRKPIGKPWKTLGKVDGLRGETGTGYTTLRLSSEWIGLGLLLLRSELKMDLHLFAFARAGANSELFLGQLF